MVQLDVPSPTIDIESYVIQIQQTAHEALAVDDVFRQCAYVPAFGYYWGIGLSDTYPPVIFCIDPDESTIDTLGFAPHLPGPIVRMGVDETYIHLVVTSPEDDELYYRIARDDLSFAYPRGTRVTDDHRELLYA